MWTVVFWLISVNNPNNIKPGKGYFQVRMGDVSKQHYPCFDNPFLLYRVTYPFLSLAGRGIFVQRVTTWRMEYGKN